MAGYDTASYVNDVYSAAGSRYGTPAFWLRYFSPCQTTPLNKSSSNEVSECRAIWNSGGHHLGPITVPTQSRLGNTGSGAAYGHADAQTLASALYATWGNVAPLMLPSNGILYCWLDQEPNYDLCLQYWNGWAGYLNGYVWSDGTLPLYACLYTNPCSAQKNCSTIGNANASPCWAIVRGGHVQRLRGLKRRADAPLAVRAERSLRPLGQCRHGPWRGRDQLRQLLLRCGL
jgi:hypothetical protein